MNFPALKSAVFTDNTVSGQPSRLQNQPQQGVYPRVRMRRKRASGWIREMVAENHLTVRDLIWPAFVCEGVQTTEPIAAMPGVARYSIDLMVEQARKAHDIGVPAMALFPVVPAGMKTACGSEALNPDNLLCRALQAIKREVPDLGIITDVALDPYTSHGHDGILDESGRVMNDETIEILARQALIQAQAGADIVAPSDMMDGRVGIIRDMLDTNGFEEKAILAYTAKYASAFYGPFRDAVNSRNFLKGDKKTYQMDPANGDEALREAELDIAEGADMLMVKPGMPCLDIVYRLKSTFHMPVMAYQVSGEYSMIRAASDSGWLDYNAAITEAALAFKRAGADAVLSYAALDLAAILD